MIFSINGLFVIQIINDIQHNWQSSYNTLFQLSLCWVSLCWGSRFIYCYAECRYSECRYAECRYAECRYAECHYAECRYAECHYTECHQLNVIILSVIMLNVAAPLKLLKYLWKTTPSWTWFSWQDNTSINFFLATHSIRNVITFIQSFTAFVEFKFYTF
jgi:hypothetical protein